jgi:hypothetical protein
MDLLTLHSAATLPRGASPCELYLILSRWV